MAVAIGSGPYAGQQGRRELRASDHAHGEGPEAEVVVLATPWGAAEAALKAAGNLTGKILIDCTNPLGPGLRLMHDQGTGGERVAGWAPGARVVKAFNTLGANNFGNAVFSGQTAVMPYCGDDADAKATVAGLIRELGFEAIDVGPLANAGLMESFAAFWIWLAINGQGRDFAFALVRR